MRERESFVVETIPDFAMQPAREEEEEGFDPRVYERLLEGLEIMENQQEPAPAEAAPVAAVEVAPAPVAAVEKAPAEAAPAPEREAAPTLEPLAPAPEREAAPAPEPTPTPPAPTPPAEPTVTVEEAVMETDTLRLVDMVPAEVMRIRLEEDILVPDVKPDLASILSMDGTVQFTEKREKIQGEILLQTLYAPQGKGADHSIIAIESRIPFQKETGGREAWNGTDGREVRNETSGGAAWKEKSGGEEENLGRKSFAKIESMEYSVVNERKFRVKAVIAVEGRCYRKRKLELFQGIQGDSVQMLQEKLVVTDVIRRKTEPLELEEDLMIPDSLPDVGNILRCDGTIVENRKQINGEKAVISGTVYYNIMYLPAEPVEGDGDPVLFQGKSDFTHFSSLGRSLRKDEEKERRGDDTFGGRAFFSLTKCAAEPKATESGRRRLIHVKTQGDGFVEFYCDRERQVVIDAYHHQKEMVFRSEPITMMRLCPGGICETTVRDVVSIPGEVEGLRRVAFLSGELRKVVSKVEGGKNVTQGNVLIKLVCLAENSGEPFQMGKEIPFRIASELPQGMEELSPDNEVKLKELHFDKLNDRQIEVNASLMVNGAVIHQKQCPMIESAGFMDVGAEEKERPGLVLYISRSGDTLWKIAKKYGTTMESLSKINQVTIDEPLSPGKKLLIVT